MVYESGKSEICASRSGEITTVLLSHRIEIIRYLLRIAFAGVAAYCGAIGYVTRAMNLPCPLDTINPNTDPPASLVRLQGVGPALAAAIVEYRQQHGAFTQVEDLDAVPRIGPATVDKMRNWISLDSRQSTAE
ncbi:MAG: helix-hairpin-helix domain-containing protein [Sedimentisphaerales bacterium]|nr:helix-hairpin-helix domain-containing protein [Sedimentisphaerales bacterium]